MQCDPREKRVARRGRPAEWVRCAWRAKVTSLPFSAGFACFLMARGYPRLPALMTDRHLAQVRLAFDALAHQDRGLAQATWKTQKSDERPRAATRTRALRPGRPTRPDQTQTSGDFSPRRHISCSARAGRATCAAQCGHAGAEGGDGRGGVGRGGHAVRVRNHRLVRRRSAGWQGARG